ncbi:MAG: PilZ domain-containing protein [Bdellovibrionales bacterium]
MKKIGVLCKELDYQAIEKQMRGGAWQLYHIKTAPEAWISMKSMVFDAFVFFFSDWEDKHIQMVRLLKDYLSDTPLIAITQNIASENIEKLEAVEDLVVLDIENDIGSISPAITKYFAGQDVANRNQKRFRAAQFVKVYRDGETVGKSLRLRNVSYTGAAFDGTIDGLHEGQIVFVEVGMADKNLPSKVRSVVRWIKKETTKIPEQAGIIGFGVEFT